MLARLNDDGPLFSLVFFQIGVGGVWSWVSIFDNLSRSGPCLIVLLMSDGQVSCSFYHLSFVSQPASPYYSAFWIPGRLDLYISL